LLSPVERRCLLEAPVFGEIRERLAVNRWKDVWKFRTIVAKGKNPISAGPVAFANLLKKQEATLAFLHAHHADLKHAIELAGPNLESSQESWHRVFRDAERAVVNSSLAAFPELQHVPSRYREFSLWHVQGTFTDVAGVAAGVLPRWLTDAFGDQDGVYPSGARQYRSSMNHVAEWARDAGLMDFAGQECIPRSVSLIEALLDEDDERFTALQARDGYAGGLEAVSHTLAPRPGVSRAMVAGFLRGLEIFSALDDAEIEELAGRARRVATVPTQDVVVEGRAGASLFIVESGSLEVLRRSSSGVARIGRLRAGSVFGELALLTGEPRSASVRSIDYAVLVEISKPALEPILERRPRIIDALSDLLATRMQATQAGAATASRAGLAQRMTAFLFEADRVRRTVRLRTRQPEELVSLLQSVKILRPLNGSELRRLAERATVTTHDSQAPIVVQGEKGSSVFVVETGQVEIVVRRDGADEVVALLGRGDVFGEMALLTGERRSATVRAAEGQATVVEISKSDLLPLIAQRPPIILEISELLAARQAENRSLARHDGASLARRMRSFFLG
jgi:CRP-like cAMP-binding protein